MGFFCWNFVIDWIASSRRAIEGQFESNVHFNLLISNDQTPEICLNHSSFECSIIPKVGMRQSIDDADDPWPISHDKINRISSRHVRETHHLRRFECDCNSAETDYSGAIAKTEVKPGPKNTGKPQQQITNSRNDFERSQAQRVWSQSNHQTTR